ncbi:glycosyltransferase, partial [Candidatus Pelagibacter sp.]|nr:glycosyltransferase [Candidatus Pelagibacter sp.]
EDAIKKLNKKIDIICITSKFDGTPNVLGEAVSYKIPCLAPRNVGLSNMILLNGKGGYLYKSNSKNDFKNKLSSMLMHYDEAINRSKLAYKALDRFSYNKTLLKLKRYINEVI